MRNLKFLALAAMLSTALTQSVQAADINVPAQAEFRLAISLSATGIDFTTGANEIDYTGTPDNADIIAMGTDGNITYSTSDFAGATTGTPGAVTITATDGQSVAISCTTTAVIGDTTNTLTVSALEIEMNGGVPFQDAGVDDACAGMGVSPLSYTMLAGTDVINIGGRILGGSGTVTPGVYSTATGGTPAQVRVVYN